MSATWQFFHNFRNFALKSQENAQELRKAVDAAPEVDPSAIEDLRTKMAEASENMSQVTDHFSKHFEAKGMSEVC